MATKPSEAKVNVKIVGRSPRLMTQTRSVSRLARDEIRAQSVAPVKITELPNKRRRSNSLQPILVNKIIDKISTVAKAPRSLKKFDTLSLSSVGRVVSQKKVTIAHSPKLRTQSRHDKKEQLTGAL